MQDPDFDCDERDRAGRFVFSGGWPVPVFLARKRLVSQLGLSPAPAPITLFPPMLAPKFPILSPPKGRSFCFSVKGPFAAALRTRPASA